jgi:hypothetical protein
MKLNSLNRKTKLAIVVTLLLAGVIMAYYRSRGVFSEALEMVLSFAYAALAVFAVKTIGVTSGDNPKSPFFGIRLNWRNVAKCGVCLVAAFVWIPIALSFGSDTTAGMFVLLTPPLILGTAALFFISRSY